MEVGQSNALYSITQGKPGFQTAVRFQDQCGQSVHGGLLPEKNKLGMNRLGLTVGTKVGHAVVRNRVRRRLREAYRMQEAGILKGYDIVIVARVRAAGAAYQALYNSLADSLVRLKLMQRCNKGSFAR